MIAQDAVPYLAPLLPAAVSALDSWYRWRKEKQRPKGYLSLTLIAASVLVAWYLLFLTAAASREQLTQTLRDAAIQAERAEKAQTELRSQYQDLDARLATADRRLQALTTTIANPKVRKEAEAIHTELQRGLVENLHTEATVTVEVKRAQIETTLALWPFAFWAIALLFSFYYCVFAIRVFVPAESVKRDWTWRWHQRWFNFVGAITGWLALYLLIVKLKTLYPASLAQLTFLDLLVFLIGVVGITGHLPYTLAGLITSLADLFAKALDKVSK